MKKAISNICDSVYVFVRTIKPNQLKVWSPRVIYLGVSRPPTNIRSKVNDTESENAKCDRVASVSYALLAWVMRSTVCPVNSIAGFLFGTSARSLHLLLMTVRCFQFTATWTCCWVHVDRQSRQHNYVTSPISLSHRRLHHSGHLAAGNWPQNYRGPGMCLHVARLLVGLLLWSLQWRYQLDHFR